VHHTNQDRGEVRPCLRGGRADVRSDLFQTPTTAAHFGNRLAVVHAKFDTGIPPKADQYEMILVHA